jgi:hypothetical protein
MAIGLRLTHGPLHLADAHFAVGTVRVGLRALPFPSEALDPDDVGLEEECG